MVGKVICWQQLFSQTDRAKSIDAPLSQNNVHQKVYAILIEPSIRGEGKSRRRKTITL